MQYELRIILIIEMFYSEKKNRASDQSSVLKVQSQIVQKRNCVLAN